MKVCIGIATTGLIRIETLGSVLGIMPTIPGEVLVTYQASCYVHVNRTNIVQKAMQERADYLLFVDSDMMFAVNSFGLLFSQQKDIIGANYNMRRLPLRSTVKMSRESTNEKPTKWSKEPFKCYAVPTGLMLIKMSVFDRIAKPWFAYKWAEENMLVGEDVWFCEQAYQAGIEVWCDPRITIKHIGEFPY